MIFPRLAGNLVDLATASGHSFLHGMYENAAYVLGFLLLQCACSYGRVYFFSRVSERGTAALRQALFDGILHAPFTYFHRARSGDLFSRLTVDVSLIQNTFSITFVELLRQVGIICVGLFMVYSLAPLLTLVLLLGLPFLVLLAIFLGRKIRGYARLAQDAQGSVGHVMEEAIHLVKTIKSFAAEDWQGPPACRLARAGNSRHFARGQVQGTFHCDHHVPVVVGRVGRRGVWGLARAARSHDHGFPFFLHTLRHAGGRFGGGAWRCI